MMFNNRPIRLIGIIIICVTVILIISGIKGDVDHTKRIENALNMSEECKQQLNYKHLVADIKAVENRKKPKHAKETEVKDGAQIMGVQVDSGRKEYVGEGYTIKLPPASDVTIYAFYHDDESIYSYVGDKYEEASNAVPRIAKTILIVVLYGGLILTELILCIKYSKK